MKTTAVSIRIDPDVKSATETILDMLGITLSEAVTMMAKQIIWRRALPFPVALPDTLEIYNQDTLDSFEEARAICEGRIQTKSYRSFKELVDEINAEIAAEVKNADA